MAPTLMAAGRNSNTLTKQIVSATYALPIACISINTDASFLSSLYKGLSKGLSNTLRLLSGSSSLPPHIHTSLFNSSRGQIASMAENRKKRAEKSNANPAPSMPGMISCGRRGDD